MHGAFQGGLITHESVPVTFNTGQILIGLAAGAARFEDARYLEATRHAATWLRDSLDEDGCWRRFPTPFAQPGEKSYETHVSWGLLEAERVLPGQGFAEVSGGAARRARVRRRMSAMYAARSRAASQPARPSRHPSRSM